MHQQLTVSPALNCVNTLPCETLQCKIMTEHCSLLLLSFMSVRQ